MFQCCHPSPTPASAIALGRMGEYQLQAAIAAVHDQAPSHAATERGKILALYDRLEQVTASAGVGR